MSPAVKQSWRDFIKIHPAADLFPMMSPDELKVLGEDIQKNGLNSQIVLWCRDECPKDKRGRCDPGLANTEDISLIDGRNRLDAMEAVGLRIEVRKGGMGLDVTKTMTCVADEDAIDLDGTISIKKGEEYEYEDDFRVETTILFEKEDGRVVCDPYVLADSLNLHRRHLTAEQKRELIEKRLKANPEMSDRAIAKEVKVDHKTVAAKREKLEATGEIPQLKERVGGDGKARTRPAEKPQRAPISTKPATSSIPRPAPDCASASGGTRRPRPSRRDERSAAAGSARGAFRARAGEAPRGHGGRHRSVAIARADRHRQGG